MIYQNKTYNRLNPDKIIFCKIVEQEIHLFFSRLFRFNHCRFNSQKQLLTQLNSNFKIKVKGWYFIPFKRFIHHPPYNQEGVL